MNDESKDETSSETSGPVGGERLAEARRLKQISLPDIARELHLDEAKVQALEENRFDVLGAPVFAKGHMRKYAELVGVSIDDVLADYYTMNRSAGAPPVVGPPRERVRDFSLSPWVFVIPVIVILAVLAWQWLGRVTIEPAPVMQPQTQPVESSTTSLPAVESAPAAEATEEATPGITELPAPAPTVADNPPPVPVAEPIAQLDEVALTLAFSGDCWTEVTDADGTRLFFDLGSAGRRVNVSGKAPLRVLLGNSNNVAVSVNGEPYSIAPSQLRGDTARLTIDN